MSNNILNDISRVYLEQVSTSQVEEGVRPGNVETPLDKAAFKKRRRSLAGKEKSAEARARGHEGKTWADSGRTYSPDEARSRRAKMSDVDRSARHSTAVDPDNEDTDSYSADKTKNPKKLRKQKAMGESAVPGKPAERLGAVTAIPQDEREAARQRTLAKAKEKREKMGESVVGDRARNAVADQKLDDAQRDTQSSIDKMKKGNTVTRAAAHIAAKRVESDVRKSSAYGPQRPKPGTTGAVRIEGLDPVGKEDADVDNDGKSNTKKDKYLMHRRNVIKQELSTQKEAKEVKKWWDDDGDGKGYEKGEVEGKFNKKKKKTVKEGYSNWRQDLSEVITDKETDKKISEKKVNNKVTINPKLNIGEAIQNLGGELIEMVEIEEKTLTAPETKKKEEIVKSMKKNLSGFKSRYGDRAKEVMYATATKQAKKVAEDVSTMTSPQQPVQQPTTQTSNPAAASALKSKIAAQKKELMARKAQLSAQQSQLGKGVALNTESTADDALALVKKGMNPKSILGSPEQKAAQAAQPKPKPQEPRKLQGYSIPGAPKEKSYND